MIFQFTGLSGSGKSTLAMQVEAQLKKEGLSVRVVDGDQMRNTRSKDLGFSKADRIANVLRMAEWAASCREEVILISAINPYQEARAKLKNDYNAKLIWIKCGLGELIKRDTKDLYRKALLPEGHPEKIMNLTGVNDPFEYPLDADLIVNTQTETIQESTDKIMHFLLQFIRES